METFRDRFYFVLRARYSRSFYHVRYQKVEMSPTGFNTDTLMTNNLCSMISCHCQNLVLMLQCYSPRGKGTQNKKVLSELFLDLAETLLTQLRKRQLLHAKHEKRGHLFYVLTKILMKRDV